MLKLLIIAVLILWQLKLISRYVTYKSSEYLIPEEFKPVVVLNFLFSEITWLLVGIILLVGIQW